MVFYSIAKYITSHLLIPSLVTGGMNGGNGGNGGDTKFGNIITLPGGKGGPNSAINSDSSIATHSSPTNPSLYSIKILVSVSRLSL